MFLRRIDWLDLNRRVWKLENKELEKDRREKRIYAIFFPDKNPKEIEADEMSTNEINYSFFLEGKIVAIFSKVFVKYITIK